MRVLLYLNGPEGCQTGIEDGFMYLKESGEIHALKWFYLESYSRTNGVKVALEKALYIAQVFQPTVVVIFHVGKLNIEKSFYENLKNLDSEPLLIYDEGDMYGGWSKPISNNLITAFTNSDVVSIRGLGKFYESVAKYNKNIIYTPHHADVARFDRAPYILPERNNKLVLIGNRIKPRYFSSIRRLPGAGGRESFIKAIGNAFPNDFVLYGNGWDGFVGNRGVVDFYRQLEVYRDSWITVAYEHYPTIPYYFSNRLPIALLAGSLYVCHYHEGYENIFKGEDFIFFYKTNKEAIDLIHYIQSLSDEDMLHRSARARDFSLNNFTPKVVWKNMIRNATKIHY